MADSSDSGIDPNALAQSGPFDASALFGPVSPQGPASPPQDDNLLSTSSTFNEIADLLGMTEEYRNMASRIISKSTPETQYENFVCLSTSILQSVRSRSSNSDESTMNKRHKLSWEPAATYVDWLNVITRETLLSPKISSYSDSVNSDPIEDSFDRLIWEAIMAQSDAFKLSYFPEGFGTSSGAGVKSIVKAHMRNNAMKNAKAELRIKLMTGVLPKGNILPTIAVPEINMIHLKVHNYCVEKSKASTELEIGKVLKPEVKIRIILLRMQTLNSYKLSHPAKQSQWFHIDHILKEIRDENKSRKNVKYETAFFKELLRRDATLFTGKTKYADYPSDVTFAPPTHAEVIQILGE